MHIPEPSFVLKDCNAKEPTLIYLQSKFTSDGKQQRVVISTGNKVHPDYWDNIKKRAIVVKRNSESSEINNWLDKIAITYKSVFRNLMFDGITPTKEILEAKVKELLNLKPQQLVQKNTLYSFIEEFIEESRSFKSANTVKSYRTTYRRIKEFGIKNGKAVEFEDITIEWRAKFLQFIQQLGSTKNTEGKHIKILKVFLNQATDRGYNTNLSFKKKSFSRPVEQVRKIFLTESDINKLLSLDLSSTKLLEIVRDYFVIGCYTGLRYGDIISLKQEHFKGDRIVLETRKTREEVAIPFNSIVKRILEKYNYSLPKAPCNQIFNRYLKQIGKKAELNDTFTVEKTKGGSIKKETYKMWQILSCHSARRSFITNCIMNDISPNQIKLMTGHRNSRVFDGYVSMTKKQNADKLKEHKFFN